MAGVRVSTNNGGVTVLDEKTFQPFAAGLRGALLRPVDPGYDEARRIW